MPNGFSRPWQEFVWTKRANRELAETVCVLIMTRAGRLTVLALGECHAWKKNRCLLFNEKIKKYMYLLGYTKYFKCFATCLWDSRIGEHIYKDFSKSCPPKNKYRHFERDSDWFIAPNWGDPSPPSRILSKRYQPSRRVRGSLGCNLISIHGQLQETHGTNF